MIIYHELLLTMYIQLSVPQLLQVAILLLSIDTNFFKAEILEILEISIQVLTIP